MTTPRPTPFPAIAPRAREFTLFVTISNSEDEPPSPDRTPA
ncbi:hypothetical protein Tco_0518864, partial [Tanacetum coccineum]